MFHIRLPPPRNLTERFANVVMLARHAVADAQVRKGLDTAVAWLIDGYLRRVVQRFARLVKMAEEGRLTPPRKRKPRAEGAEAPTPKPRARPKIRMSGAIWIARHAQGAVTAGWQLRALLDDPDLRRLIPLDPRFGAVLRPLLAALGTSAAPGQLPPPEPRARRERKAKPPKPPKPPRQPRARKVKWRCAKPPNAGLEFYDPISRLWHA